MQRRMNFIDKINNVDLRVVKLDDALMHANDVLNFMASQGSKLFSVMELLAMERIHDIKNWCCKFNININKAM